MVPKVQFYATRDDINSVRQAFEAKCHVSYVISAHPTDSHFTRHASAS